MGRDQLLWPDEVHPEHPSEQSGCARLMYNSYSNEMKEAVKL